MHIIRKIPTRWRVGRAIAIFIITLVSLGCSPPKPTPSPSPAPTVCVTEVDDQGRRDNCFIFIKPTPRPDPYHKIETHLWNQITMAKEDTARREAEGQPTVRPEDSENIEVKIIMDQSAGERFVDVALWLMARKTDYRFRAESETRFLAYIPILLLPELAHFPSVRNIDQIRHHFSISPPRLSGISLFTGKGACGSCHTLTGIVVPGGILGPRLDGIGTHASTRRPGMSAEEYLKEAILN